MNKEKFLDRVKKTSYCWLWMAGKNKKGYGQFYDDGKYYGAHRAAYIIFNGNIPKGLHVLHHCDNPGCVNPDHLFIGTNADNVADRHKKGRDATGNRHKSQTKPESVPSGKNHFRIKHPEKIPRGYQVPANQGEKHGMSKLTEDEVREIRRLKGELSQRKIAEKFGVTQMTILKIHKRKLWKYLD